MTEEVPEELSLSPESHEEVVSSNYFPPEDDVSSNETAEVSSMGRTIPPAFMELLGLSDTSSCGYWVWMRIQTACFLQSMVEQNVVTTQIVEHQDGADPSTDIVTDLVEYNDRVPLGLGLALEENSHSMVFRLLYRVLLFARRALVLPLVVNPPEPSTLPFSHQLLEWCTWDSSNSTVSTSTTTTSTVTHTDEETEVTDDSGVEDESLIAPVTPYYFVLEYLDRMLLRLPSMLLTTLGTTASRFIGVPSPDSTVAALADNSALRMQFFFIGVFICLVTIVMFVLVKARYAKYTKALDNLVENEVKAQEAEGEEPNPASSE